ncbi:MAG: hypothetical protein L0H93_07295, partial [Nocardioides sp.]|nr:hypothetical protein [Nocardioides sp.]
MSSASPGVGGIAVRVAAKSAYSLETRHRDDRGNTQSAGQELPEECFLHHLRLYVTPDSPTV